MTRTDEDQQRSVGSKQVTMTQAELCDEARSRFGDDPLAWAFRCPSCGDVATPADFQAAAADPNRIGQQCIGRSIGALTGPRGPGTDGITRGDAARGCDWVAFGLIRGPWTIVMPSGKQVGSFPLAPAPAQAPQ